MKLAGACAAAAATGFIALSYELLWIRTYAFSTAGDAHCFGELLGAYLAGLAVGAFVTRRWCEGEGDARRAAVVAGILVGVANVAAYLAAPAVGWAICRFHPDRTLILYGLAAALLGTTLPLVAHAAVPPDERAGAGLARIYVANIVGSTLGTLLTGFVLLDVLPLRHVAQVLCVVGAVASIAIVGLRGVETRRRVAVAAIAGVLVVLALPPVNERLYGDLWERLLYRKSDAPPFARVIENRGGVICADTEGRVWGGGAYDSDVNVDVENDRNLVDVAFAVPVLHPNPKRMMLIGLGTGSWAQILANCPGLEHLTVVDINPGYVDLIAGFPTVRSVLTNPKVTIEVDDARRWMTRHADKFDLILQNTTFHWRANITNIVSAEYMKLVDEHLNAGGVFYVNTTQSLAIHHTVAAQFEHVRRYRGFAAGSHRPLTFDKDAVRAALLAWTIDGKRCLDESHDAAKERLDMLLGAPKWTTGAHPLWEEDEHLRKRVADAPIVTDDNMASEFERKK